jgi:hypothetical protein
MKATKRSVPGIVPALAALALAAMVVTALPAQAGSGFVFYGYARYGEGDVPDDDGSTLEVFGTLEPATGMRTPLAVDLETYEYTIHIQYLMVIGSVMLTEQMKQVSYCGGLLRIYRDELAGGTGADYTDPASFTDGERLLSVRGLCLQTALFDLDGDLLWLGDGSGTFDFAGGDQLPDLVANGYDTEGWQLFASPVADANPLHGITVPEGFLRVFNIKLTPPNNPQPVSAATWGGVKNLYR